MLPASFAEASAFAKATADKLEVKMWNRRRALR